MNLIRFGIQHVGTAAQILMGRSHNPALHPGGISNQVNCNMIFKKAYPGMTFDVVHQCLFDNVAGKIAGMDDPFLRMPPFQTEIKFKVTRALLRERHPPVHKFPDPFRTALHNHFYNIVLAKSVTGLQGVSNMKIKSIGLAKDRGYTPLGIIGAGLHGLLFGYDGHLPVFGHL